MVIDWVSLVEQDENAAGGSSKQPAVTPKRRWTRDEDTELRELVVKYGEPPFFISLTSRLAPLLNRFPTCRN